MLNFLNKKFVSNILKQAVNSHQAKPIFTFPIRNFSINNPNKDRNAIFNSKNLVISKSKLSETSQESIRKSLEESYNQFINSNQDFSQTFKDLSKNLPHLKFSKNTVHYQNQHLKFIIDKAIESLQNNFSYPHLNEFLRFCDFFKIDDPSLFDKISAIVNQNSETLSLEEKLKIMTDYNFTLPAIEDLPDVNSLNFKEATYLLYLKVVKNQFEDNPLKEIQEKVINTIDQNFRASSSNLSFLLLVTLIHLNSSIGGLEEKIIQVTRTLEQNASQLPTTKLINLFINLHDPQFKDEKLLFKITKLIDEKIPEMNFNDIGTLIISMYEMTQNSNYPPSIQKANQTLVKSLTVNILPDKSRNLNIGHPLLTALLNLHEFWGVWDPNMSEIFSNLITALFDVRRIKADTYLKLVLTIAKLDQGKIPDLCLSVLRFKIKDIIADANLQSLTTLYENIKQHKDIARQYEIYLTSKISDSIKLPGSTALNENVFLHIVKNMDSFSAEFIQDYSKKIQENIETSPIHFVLNLHSILLNNITLESLKENKSQPLLYVLEKKVAALVQQFDFISSKNYLRSLGHFAVKIEQLKNKSYHVKLIDLNNYKFTKQSHEILIPLNLTLLQNRLISELDSAQADPNRLTELGRTLLILETFNSQKSLQTYDSVLQTIWQNLQQGQLSLLSFSNILRSSSSLRDRFKSSLVDKDPQIIEKLTAALFQELDKFSSSLPESPQNLENQQPKEDLKSHHYHIFVMTNLLLSWKVTNDELGPKMKEFITSRIDDFTLDDLIAVISFGSNIFANERKELYSQVLPRLGWLILNKKLAHHQAFELLMSLHLNTLDEKTFFELEKNIAANFLQFKVQDIMKLIAKFKRYNIKSTKILWNVVRYYFRPEYITNMTPIQVSVFSDILISEKYGDIIPSIEHYLIKRGDFISRDTNLAKLLFLTANFSKKSFSQELVNLWTKNLESLSGINNPQVLVYLLGTFPVFKKAFEDSPITLNEEHLANKWKDLLQKASLAELSEVSAAIEYINDNSQGISYPWVSEKLLQETGKRTQITIDTVNIFSSLYHEKTLLQNFNQSISQCVPIFATQVKDFDSIGKFTLAWQRSLTGVPNLEHSQMIRKKALFANPNLLTSVKPLIHLLTTVAEMEKKIQNTAKDYFFTKKDYKLLNRIEDTILMRISIFKEDDINLLYHTYIETQLGSTRILGFLEKRLFK